MMAKTVVDCKKRIQELQEEIKRLEAEKVSVAPRKELYDLKKRADDFINLCFGYNTPAIVKVDITVNNFPVYLEFYPGDNVEDGEFILSEGDVPPLEDFLGRNKTVYDVLEKNKQVKESLKNVRRDFKTLCRDVKRTAKQYECDAEDIWEHIDPNHDLHC